MGAQDQRLASAWTAFKCSPEENFAKGKLIGRQSGKIFQTQVLLFPGPGNGCQLKDGQFDYQLDWGPLMFRCWPFLLSNGQNIGLFSFLGLPKGVPNGVYLNRDFTQKRGIFSQINLAARKFSHLGTIWHF